MGIYKTSSIGVGRKSVGENTYKRVRGRTIVSARITTNSSNTKAQKVQRTAFGTVASFAKIAASYIDQAFVKTTYGSSRNQFVKQNASLIAWLRSASNLPDGTVAQIVAALSDGVVVKAGYGSGLVAASLAVDGTALSGEVTYSDYFAEGDQIVFAAIAGYTLDDESGETYEFQQCKVLAYTVTADDVATETSTLSVDSTKLADLAEAFAVPTGTLASEVYAVTVIRDGEPSVCYFRGASVTSDSNTDDQGADEV